MNDNKSIDSLDTIIALIDHMQTETSNIIHEESFKYIKKEFLREVDKSIKKLKNDLPTSNAFIFTIFNNSLILKDKEIKLENCFDYNGFTEKLNAKLYYQFNPILKKEIRVSDENILSDLKSPERGANFVKNYTDLLVDTITNEIEKQGGLQIMKIDKKLKTKTLKGLTSNFTIPEIYYGKPIFCDIDINKPVIVMRYISDEKIEAAVYKISWIENLMKIVNINPFMDNQTRYIVSFHPDELKETGLSISKVLTEKYGSLENAVRYYVENNVNEILPEFEADAKENYNKKLADKEAMEKEEARINANIKLLHPYQDKKSLESELTPKKYIYSKLWNIIVSALSKSSNINFEKYENRIISNKEEIIQGINLIDEEIQKTKSKEYSNKNQVLESLAKFLTKKSKSTNNLIYFLENSEDILKRREHLFLYYNSEIYQKFP